MRVKQQASRCARRLLCIAQLGALRRERGVEEVRRTAWTTASAAVHAEQVAEARPTPDYARRAAQLLAQHEAVRGRREQRAQVVDKAHVIVRRGRAAVVSVAEEKNDREAPHRARFLVDHFVVVERDDKRGDIRSALCAVRHATRAARRRLRDLAKAVVSLVAAPLVHGDNTGLRPRAVL